MAPPLIKAENLSKCYKLYPNPGARVKEALIPFGKRRHTPFWALKPLSFEVHSGQSFGIVGRNGSGKSTLLQLIAGVLSPSTGWVQCQGRIAALLELGTGFNPEFSGFENVMVNGAVMGFTREEMIERIPAILEFSELGDFIHQPVKTYSSGMYVRLAFAASVTVDPDILIVDEALAVGDSRFQAKCFRKFEEFREKGKTILMVTHDSAAIVRYCDDALLLDQGELLGRGEPGYIINRYSELLPIHSVNVHQVKARKRSELDAQEAVLPAEDHLKQFLLQRPEQDQFPCHHNHSSNEHTYGTGQAEIMDYLLIVNDQIEPEVLPTHSQIKLVLKVRFAQHVPMPIYAMTLKNSNGYQLFGTNSLKEGVEVLEQEAGSWAHVMFSFELPLNSGDYTISLGIIDHQEKKEEKPLQRRYDVIRLKVKNPQICYGAVDLQAEFEEVGDE